MSGAISGAFFPLTNLLPSERKYSATTYRNSPRTPIGYAVSEKLLRIMIYSKLRSRNENAENATTTVKIIETGIVRRIFVGAQRIRYIAKDKARMFVARKAQR